ncbi:MAG TPA: DUF2158 domain-containing protein [Beijerinckiaceae bacterium]|jgi:uncharacterized protein YodC (DUF2158 family)|nr:DUF2158 domain-containing protein [Beijerinckiaceae bacterium]
MPFEPGLVVQLKSGGPAMTVVTVDADNIHCVYYAEVDEVRVATIAAVALVAIAPEDHDEDEDEEEDED